MSGSQLDLFMKFWLVLQARQWLVFFHSQQKAQHSFTDLLSTISEIRSNWLPKRTMAASKMATSLGFHSQQAENVLTGLMRRSKSLFLQRELTVSRYCSMGFFFLSGLVLKISGCGVSVCRMGCLKDCLYAFRRGVRLLLSILLEASMISPVSEAMTFLMDLGLDVDFQNQVSSSLAALLFILCVQ